MINKRIKELIDTISNGNKRAFSGLVGVSPTVIENIVGTRQGKPGYDLLEKIAFAIENINMNWVFTGEGQMFREERSEGIIHEDPQAPTPKPDESILYNMYKDLMEEKKEKEKKIEQLTNELRAMERKVGTLEAKLENTATLGNRTAEPVSTAKRSSQSKAFATFVSAPSNEYESR